MIKRIPLILLIMSLLSFVYMVYVRIISSGLNLLYVDSERGRRAASLYYVSVVFFIVLFAAFVVSVFVADYVRKRPRKKTEDDELFNDDIHAGFADMMPQTYSSPQEISMDTLPADIPELSFAGNAKAQSAFPEIDSPGDMEPETDLSADVLSEAVPLTDEAEASAPGGSAEPGATEVPGSVMIEVPEGLDEDQP